MNYGRLVLAAVGGVVAYFAVGGVIFGLVPQMVTEFEKHSAIYRSREGDTSPMAFGMAAMLVAIVVVAVLYTMMYRGGSGLAEGGRDSPTSTMRRGETRRTEGAL